MDALIIQPVQISLPKPAAQAPVLPKADVPASSVIANDQGVDAQVQAAEQRRLTAVQHAAQDIANVYVLGDTTFTIFKDTTGQYVTRFTSLRDGRVTYIPEPQLLTRNGSGNGRSVVLNIEV